MVLSTEWSQVEIIDLVNDGSGLGFGIVGGRSTGVVIKSILPGGIADKDSRLQSGDHILQIGDVNLRGLAADQVATVLRQAGAQVRMVVARPVEPSSADFQSFGCSAPIVPTKILTDPEELDRQLQQNGYSSFYAYNDRGSCDDLEQTDVNSIDANPASFNSLDVVVNNNNNTNGFSPTSESQVVIIPADIEYTLPETERFTVELTKNEYGLGITIAGYVCEREDLSGIFVKSLNEGSEAFKCGKINTNDRIVEVDGQSLQGFTNYEAVEKIKQTGGKVVLTLERYLRGPKFEQLQEALAIQEQKDLSPPSPSQTTLSWIPIEAAEGQIEPEGESVVSVNSEIYEQNLETKEIFIEEDFEANPDDDLEPPPRKMGEAIIGSDTEIVVANLTKLKGLGISLEGTVDVEGGIELRPHHYIRSILPEGPVGQNGKLSSGDELLEVNGQKLLGIKHVEVVKILRELPSTVRLVCARKHEENRVINTSQDREAFEARNILGGSLKNLLPQPEQRLLKALSDTSINTSSTVTVTSEPSLQKAKSRSLEVTNLAMWSEEVEYVELLKTDRGLGFSILDYQDPLDPKATVIVVRSLVPNGAAEHDGRITPGDRLISVNGKVIKNVTLDQAVQALKGTLPGPVKLGISKPLPSSRASENVSTIGS
ncbi:Patj homolog-like Protein [Tribolium castaneum]|uniref:Patj homolog-like Protein n=1 Tax=Tribolium castaneum TaxID=7070 RepID=D6WRN8_TRICA|nr:PREDICTED: patj homolog isoform X1 [Tribolium castaneum]EFA07063.2 Patj homolog-like Protein [Tribolium castaneum]|eukprot:XP_015837543.1 PREDICTED: patj homolog isoform X1 [Tribolium castaneum]